MLLNLAMLSLIISVPANFILTMLIHRQWTESSVDRRATALSLGQLNLLNLVVIVFAAFVIGSVLPDTRIQLHDPNRLDEFGMVTLLSLTIFSVAFALIGAAAVNLFIYCMQARPSS